MKVIIKKTQRILDDIFKVDRAVLQFEKFDGTMSREVVRLNFERGDSAAALVVNPTTQKIVLVKQFRYPVYTLDKTDAWMLEIVAGSVPENSSPEDTIIREISEEIGYKVKNVTLLFRFYSSPGGSNEKVHLFYAEVDSSDRVSAGGGLASEDEDIQLHEISFDAAFNMMDNGEIIDGKTIIALQWLKANLKN